MAEHALGGELAQVIREEDLGCQRLGPLLTGLLLFGLTAPWLQERSAWALSFGLWIGHAMTDALSGWLGRRLRTRPPCPACSSARC